MTILEALGMGLPVVTTAVGGISEVLEFGVTGESADGTAESIRRAVERVANSYQLYSLNAYKASEQYLYTAVNERVLYALLGGEALWRA